MGIHHTAIVKAREIALRAKMVCTPAHRQTAGQNGAATNTQYYKRLPRSSVDKTSHADKVYQLNIVGNLEMRSGFFREGPEAQLQKTPRDF
jgi:hypothetical protein